MFLISEAQAKEIALTIKDDILAYIEAHQAEYQDFIKREQEKSAPAKEAAI